MFRNYFLVNPMFRGKVNALLKTAQPLRSELQSTPFIAFIDLILRCMFFKVSEFFDFSCLHVRPQFGRYRPGDVYP